MAVGGKSTCYADRVPASCPVCKRRVITETPESPFCSERCRLVDLGRWLEGDYRIPDPDPVPPYVPDAEADEPDGGTH